MRLFSRIAPAQSALSNLLDKAYDGVSPMKSTKCKFANLVVSRKIASRPTNLEGLTRIEQGNPDSSNRSFASSCQQKIE